MKDGLWPHPNLPMDREMTVFEAELCEDDYSDFKTSLSLKQDTLYVFLINQNCIFI